MVSKYVHRALMWQSMVVVVGGGGTPSPQKEWITVETSIYLLAHPISECSGLQV